MQASFKNGNSKERVKSGKQMRDNRKLLKRDLKVKAVNRDYLYRFNCHDLSLECNF